jgi:two-component sensor histidine kinase
MSSQFDALAPDKLKEYLAKVRLSAERLYALLENLLAWSRMQRGLVEYTPETLDLAQIADESVTLFTSNAEHKQITLTSTIQEPIIVHADYAMVNTIVRNLVSNALKFTPTGGRITLAAQTNADHVEIAVADTGRGMTPEIIAKLFRIDSQYTTTGTAGETGTGLGLHLCHDLVQKNGGTIWVESTPGQGTTFRFTLPLAPAAEAARIMTRNERRVLEKEESEPSFPTSRGSRAAIIPPAPEQLAVLADLAEIGDLTTIQHQCANLVQRDPRLKPFANELNRLAQDFHLKPLRAFLAAYKPDQPDHAVG